MAKVPTPKTLPGPNLPIWVGCWAAGAGEGAGAGAGGGVAADITCGGGVTTTTGGGVGVGVVRVTTGVTGVAMIGLPQLAMMA